jgi:GTP-binding protein
VLVVDGRAGLLPDDKAIAARLRKLGKVVLVAVNKLEADDTAADEFARLGFDHVLPISAEHGHGIGELLDEVLDGLPRVDVAEEARPLAIALVGRPNVGKSSLLNRLIGKERAVVSAIPGTTRDSVDSLLERDGHRYLFVDTAGIRRVRLLKEPVDHVSVVQARRSLERADVAVVIIDAAEGVRPMDATIAGYAQEAGRGVVIAVNKWDVAHERELKMRSFEQDTRDRLKFLAYAPMVFVSAKTGKGFGPLLATVRKVAEAGRTRATTGHLNRVIAEAAKRFAPKAAKGGKPVTILFASQIGVHPPTFVVSINHPVDLHFSYRRYLENQLRAAFDFTGNPLVLKVRARKH